MKGVVVMKKQAVNPYLPNYGGHELCYAVSDQPNKGFTYTYRGTAPAMKVMVQSICWNLKWNNMDLKGVTLVKREGAQ